MKPAQGIDTKEYKASLDKLAKLITAFVFALLLYIGVRELRQVQEAGGEISTKLVALWPVWLLLVVIAISYLFAPQSYWVIDGDLIIQRLIGNVTIRQEDMVGYKIIKHGPHIRTFGVGGLFGYFGKYYDFKKGHFTIYTTRRDNRIIVYLANGKKIIISPDDLTIVDKLGLEERA